MARTTDPNKDRNDPMIAEYWRLGEDVQDKIRSEGYEPSEVEGIAVDIHDLLQATDRIRDEIAPKVVNGQTLESLRELAWELRHIHWHCESAIAYVDAAIRAIETA